MSEEHWRYNLRCSSENPQAYAAVLRDMADWVIVDCMRSWEALLSVIEINPSRVVDQEQAFDLAESVRAAQAIVAAEAMRRGLTIRQTEHHLVH